jgi:hypothetical protein
MACTFRNAGMFIAAPCADCGASQVVTCSMSARTRPPRSYDQHAALTRGTARERGFPRRSQRLHRAHCHVRAAGVAGSGQGGVPVSSSRADRAHPDDPVRCRSRARRWPGQAHACTIACACSVSRLSNGLQGRRCCAARPEARARFAASPPSHARHLARAVDTASSGWAGGGLARLW